MAFTRKSYLKVVQNRVGEGSFGPLLDYVKLNSSFWKASLKVIYTAFNETIVTNCIALYCPALYSTVVHKGHI